MSYGNQYGGYLVKAEPEEGIREYYLKEEYVMPYLERESHSFHPILRNIELEKKYILMARVDLWLLMSLSNKFLTEKWLPGAAEKWQPGASKKTGCWISSNNYRIETEKMFHQGDATKPICFSKNNKKIPLSELPEFAGAVFLMIRLYAVAASIMTNGKYDDEKAARQLAHEIKINIDNIYSEPNLANGWQRSFLKASIISANGNIKAQYNFMGPQGIFLYSLIQYETEAGTVVLPVTNWMKTNEIWPITINIMPPVKHPLYNLNLIKEHRHAPIFLTEDITFLKNKGELYHSAIWTFWYGGVDTIKYVDWTPLYGRTVYYVLHYGTHNAKESIKAALTLYEKFIFDEGMHFKIYARGYSLDTDMDRMKESSWRHLSIEDLIDLAKSYHVPIPETLNELKDRFLFSNDMLEKVKIKFLVRPIMKEKTLCVLFAPSGIGKSWLGLSIGLGVANGKDVFSGWEVAKVPQKVYYVSGEMDKDELNNRVVVLKKIYQDTVTNEVDNFILRRVRMDLLQLEDRKKIDKDIKDLGKKPGGRVKLLVLDNLTTLVSSGDYRSGWDVLFAWLEKLKEQGLTILLIHHSNKKGAFLGTSGIKNKTDFLVHASDKDEIGEKINKMRKPVTVTSKEGKEQRAIALFNESMEYIKSLIDPNIEMYISQHKLRSVSKKDVAPIKISINPDDENPVWKVSKNNCMIELEWHEQGAKELAEAKARKSNSPEAKKPKVFKHVPSRQIYISWKLMNDLERIEAIKQCLYGGAKGVELPRYLNVSAATINKFREKHSLRDCDLNASKKEPRKRKNSSKSSGKTNPKTTPKATNSKGTPKAKVNKNK